MIRTKSEDAVSPVIGVMLMLVVTIIIAAVVAAFAGGVGADAEPAPVTVLNVEGASAGYIETVPGKVKLKDGQPQYVDGYITDETGNKVNNQMDVSGKYWYFYADNDESKIYGKLTSKGTLELGNGAIKMPDWSGSIEPVGEESLWSQYLEMGEPTENQIVKNTVTINCLHGDSLDLSKASIKVYNSDGNLIHEQKLSDSPKTFGPGDIITVTLNTQSTEFSKGKSVEIEILYGEHILVNKELTVTREW